MSNTGMLSVGVIFMVHAMRCWTENWKDNHQQTIQRHGHYYTQDTDRRQTKQKPLNTT